MSAGTPRKPLAPKPYTKFDLAQLARAKSLTAETFATFSAFEIPMPCTLGEQSDTLYALGIPCAVALADHIHAFMLEYVP